MTGTVMKNRVAAAVQKLPTDKTMKNAGRGTSAEVSTEDGKLCSEVLRQQTRTDDVCCPWYAA